jgi:NAD(P)-dependent dehydrogenase (short-subunit alcohol dehydrogenase family)
MGRLDGKTALITGAASGIGEAAARSFVEEGSRVLLTDINDERGNRIAEELGDEASYLHVDVSREKDVEKAVNTVINDWGKLDIIFNNAGLGGVSGPIDEIPEEGLDQTIGILFKGVFFGVKHAARVMKTQRYGSIINNASVSGLMTGGSPQIYCSCKAAVIHFTRVAAVELAGHGIRVNCVCPGAILTRIWTRGADMGEKAYSELAELFSQQQPIKRAGLPEDIARGVLWLASEESSYVTGHPLVIDGGLSLGWSWEKYLDNRQKLGKILQG